MIKEDSNVDREVAADEEVPRKEQDTRLALTLSLSANNSNSLPLRISSHSSIFAIV